ncbi:phosphoribosylanthranilate isomerase [Butyrivibrio sp. XPD2006]|uniref:phosphoribosylanthranilate isomerase n=1 Tax=Butyrivibrio sp. XPD2006 TaxID=1280668 RepID=UPI00041EC81F|nr:phosphoribosylanthranilate isomerase [Butyrivibrio sp. XPD2006]
MKKAKVKFCGLKRIDDIRAANELRPDYAGFVFWEKSSRNVSRDEAINLGKALLPDIKKVGVFVDEVPDRVAALLTDGVIDIAQLHGHEDEEYISRLRSLADGACVIKAFVIKSKEDLEKAKQSSADYLLLDSGKGTGQTFNWELIAEAGFDKPYFLAGGLGPENVADAVKKLKPYAVDVSSGIETDGLKDPEKMSKFMGELL